MSARRCQLERLLDIGVYAPLGLLLQGDRVVDDLAAAGRKQVAFSRSLGRAALKSLARGAAPAATTPAKSSPAASASAAAPGEVAGYESMTAKQIIALLASCTDAEADWIQSRELATKNRVTVLRAVKARD